MLFEDYKKDPILKMKNTQQRSPPPKNEKIKKQHNVKHGISPD